MGNDYTAVHVIVLSCHLAFKLAYKTFIWDYYSYAPTLSITVKKMQSHLMFDS